MGSPDKHTNKPTMGLRFLVLLAALALSHSLTTNEVVPEEATVAEEQAVFLPEWDCRKPPCQKVTREQQVLSLPSSVQSSAEPGISLQQMARDGILFVGDSPVRRMYVRSLVHMEHIHDEVLAEGMQNTAKLLSQHKLEQLYALHLTNKEVGATKDHYTGSGKHKGDYNLQYVWHDNPALMAKVNLAQYNQRYVFYGAPFLHMLYNPGWNTPICQSSYDMKTNMQTALQQLNDLGQTSDKIILIGTGNQYSENDDVINKQQMQHPEELAADRTGACKSCWHSARCEQWSRTRAGMTAANKMLVELVLTPHYDALTLVDKLEDITKNAEPGTYLGGGHYTGPIVDKKLAAMQVTAQVALQSPLR